jgi:PilZ domain
MCAQSSGRDKRQFERIRIQSSKNIWNLSMGGAYVATKNPKKLGSVLHFEIKLGGKDGTPFKAMAKVIRVLHTPNPKTGEPPGIALRFVDVDDENKVKLNKYLIEVKKSE